MNATTEHTNPNGAPTTPQIAISDLTVGQAGLRRRMAIDPDIRNRSITGAVLWAVAAALGVIQHYAPAGASMTNTAMYVYLALTGTMALLCLFVGPRLSGRGFRIAEESVVVTGWVATAALVATTGGTSSADIGLFANIMFYCAYFMEPQRAARQVLLGTVAMWAPAVYGFSTLDGSGFVARALVMTAVLWALVLLIARHRHSTERAELRARRLALSDPLTGVANLHTFEEELQFALGGARKNATTLGVAFVDVNGLKAANTVFGHAGGDELIRRTAEALILCSSETDQVARVGGDEFAVLVAGADAERMKSFESEFAIALTEVGRGQERSTFELSASIGTAVFPQDGKSPDDLMEVADGRMYNSKAALPPRLPTPETSGGRTLLDPPEPESSRLNNLVTGSAPAAALAWLLGAAMIAAAATVTGTADTHPRFALALAGLCVVMAGITGLATEKTRPLVDGLGNTLAVVIAIPAIWATGGAATPILPLVYLVVAHAAYGLSGRAAAVRIAAMLGIVGAALSFNANGGDFTGAMVIAAETLVIAGVLRFNRVRADAAERAALELSRTDALTRLANRRVFEHSLSTLAERPRRKGDVYDGGGLIIADVDNFKTINTSGGHRSGDEVLRMIAAVIEGTAGDDATVCRIGGDEFALVVPEGNGNDLMRLAAKVRAAIAGVDWHVLCEPEVTISIGYASWEHVDAWKDLVIAADLGLQQSKDKGKNTVSAATSVPRIGPVADAADVARRELA
jgi:diguanylate cyclase (GGDEF)-like protein